MSFGTWANLGSGRMLDEDGMIADLLARKLPKLQHSVAGWAAGFLYVIVPGTVAFDTSYHWEEGDLSCGVSLFLFIWAFGVLIAALVLAYWFISYLRGKTRTFRPWIVLFLISPFAVRQSAQLANETWWRLHSEDLLIALEENGRPREHWAHGDLDGRAGLWGPINRGTQDEFTQYFVLIPSPSEVKALREGSAFIQFDDREKRYTRMVTSERMKGRLLVLIIRFAPTPY